MGINEQVPILGNGERIRLLEVQVKGLADQVSDAQDMLSELVAMVSNLSEVGEAREAGLRLNVHEPSSLSVVDLLESRHSALRQADDDLSNRIDELDSRLTSVEAGVQVALLG